MNNVSPNTLTLRQEVQVKQCDGTMAKGIVRGIYDNGKNQDGSDNIGITVEYESKTSNTFNQKDVFETEK